nr:hypothetical protein [Tanacetum cinerariifolium]
MQVHKMMIQNLSVMNRPFLFLPFLLIVFQVLSVPASNVPAGGVLAGSIDSAGFGDPAASESVLAVLPPDHAANSTLPPALEDPDWIAAMQEEMQQFYNQQNQMDFEEKEGCQRYCGQI